ncbi:MAG: hypothetical protein LAT81_16175 [Oceanicaulis sp.]|nr:hypothetical protein [Oceanicaulis sp.]
MHTLEIPSKELKIDYPESIEEMNPEQYLKFIELGLHYKTERISKAQLKTKLVYILCNFYHDKRKWKKMEQIDELVNFNSNIFHIGETLESLFDGDDLRMGSVLCLIPTINFKKRKYVGPGDALNELTFGQYMDAFSHYQNYGETKDIESLKRLFVTLYRPTDRRTKRPVEYNSDNVESEARAINKMDFRYLLAALWFFEASLYYYRHDAITIDGNEIDFSLLYNKSGPSGKSQGAGLKDVLFTVAESGVFGSINKARKAKFLDVMLRLHQLHRESEKLKAKK